MGEFLVEKSANSVHWIFAVGPGFCGGSLVFAGYHLPREAGRIPRRVLPRLLWRGVDGLAITWADLSLYAERDSQSLRSRNPVGIGRDFRRVVWVRCWARWRYRIREVCLLSKNPTESAGLDGETWVALGVPGVCHSQSDCRRGRNRRWVSTLPTPSLHDYRFHWKDNQRPLHCLLMPLRHYTVALGVVTDS